MKRLIGGIILILFVLPGFVSAISKGDVGTIVFILMFIAGGGTMVYYGIKSRRRCRTESLNKIDTPPAIAAQKGLTPPEPPPPCKTAEMKINCPHCNQTLEVPPEMLGQAADCPACNRSIQLPSAQPKTPPLPATNPVIEKTTPVKPLKEEKCCVCGSDLKFSNRHWGNYGLLKDEGEICGNCTNKMQSIVGAFKFKPGNFTKAEIIDRIELPSAQPKTPLPLPATDPVIGENASVKPLKEEKCCACGNKLTFSTRHWSDYGLLKDEGEICVSCTGKMQSIVGVFKFKPKNFTKAEVVDHIRKIEQKQEENTLQKQEQRIAKQKEKEAAAFVKQELKEKLQGQRNIETRKVQEQIQNAKSYSVEYLGGVPGVDPENYINICATPSGVYAFSKEVFSKDMKERFLIEWKYISGIYHSSTTKGSDATKNALLTAGMIKNSGVAILGGLLCNGQKTEEHITITCKDDTGYESEILFRSTYDSQEIVLYLNAQRAVLYKQEKTPAMQITVENTAPVVDSIEQLKKLAELKNTGIITEEEFGMKKAELLTRI